MIKACCRRAVLAGGFQLSINGETAPFWSVGYLCGSEDKPMKQSRCRYCGRWFHPHAPGQKACPREGCRRARQREKLQSWRKRHPGFAKKWRPKVQAWAKAYPDYWQANRRRNPAYVERDNRRRRAAHRRARRAANDTGVREIFVEKLRTVIAGDPSGAANDTGAARRVEGVVEALIWRECAANRYRMAPGGSSG